MIAKKRAPPRALLLLPSTLKRSELAPTALLNPPVEFVNSANVPSPCVVLTGGIGEKRACANGCLFIRGVA